MDLARVLQVRRIPQIQLKDKPCTPMRRTVFRIHAPTLSRRNLPADPQPEARAALIASWAYRCAPKRRKELMHFCSGYARTFIFHDDTQPIATPFENHPYAGLAGREFNRITEQIIH